MSHIFIISNIGTEAALIFVFIIAESILIPGIPSSKNHHLRVLIHDSRDYGIYKIKSFLIGET